MKTPAVETGDVGRLCNVIATTSFSSFTSVRENFEYNCDNACSQRQDLLLVARNLTIKTSTDYQRKQHGKIQHRSV